VSVELGPWSGYHVLAQHLSKCCRAGIRLYFSNKSSGTVQFGSLDVTIILSELTNTRKVMGYFIGTTGCISVAQRR
jgi:hypothetical protein